MLIRSTMSLACVVFVAGVIAADELKSGPQVGEGRKGFSVPFLNGDHAGKNRCPV